MAEPKCKQSSPLMLANPENGDQLFFWPDFAIFKQRVSALCCGPDMRMRAIAFKHDNTKKNDNDRQRGGSVL